jgi:(heptosyl)LPS beta-1,4-glucosyltransferase
VGKISVVINTWNEEKNIARAISSVKKLADEVVVVDAKSTDKTVEIAKKLGVKVYHFTKPFTHVEDARTYALGRAKGDWILVLDADETISTSLSKKLREIADGKMHSRGVNSNTSGVVRGGDTRSADYYRLPRKNIIFGKWIKHSRWWPDYNIRFFRKGYVLWSEIIHSVPTTKGEGLDMEAKEALAITHYHYDTLEQYIQRMNRYSSVYAKDRVVEGYKFKWQDLIKKPSDEFLSRYFFGKGYKDGLHGLALSGLQAFFEFVIYLKIWQTEKFKKTDISVDKVIKKMKEAESDLHYWQADTLLKEVGGLKHRIRRKLKV